MSDDLGPIEAKLAEELTTASEKQIEAIREILRIQGEVLSSYEDLRDEPAPLESLFKVFYHLAAAVSWPVDRMALHIMAPDLRAAIAQLRPLTRREVCGEIHEAEQCTIPASLAMLDNGLAPFTHPNLAALALGCEVGGLGKSDALRCSFMLCGVLAVVLTAYGMALTEVGRRYQLPSLMRARWIAKEADVTPTLQKARATLRQSSESING